MNNKIIKCILIIMIIAYMANVSDIIASHRPLDDASEETNRPFNPSGGKVSEKMKNKMNNMWATISFGVQVLAVGAVVLAGLRYMFSSADQKADIKQGLFYIVIGAVFVFGAVSVIKLVTNATKNIL